MYTYPNNSQNTFGCNTPMFNTPNFGGNVGNSFGWNTPQFGWNQFGCNTPQVPNFQGFHQGVNHGFNQGVNPWGSNSWNQFGMNTPFNTNPNWQTPVNGFDGGCGYGFNTPGINTPNFNSQFGTPFNGNPNWNSFGNTMPFQNVTPFPGLYNFANTFGQGMPFGNFPFSNTTPTFGNFPYGVSTPVNGYPQAFGATPWMNGFGTPWNQVNTPFFGGFGWNTPIGWGQPKVDCEMPMGKKGEMNMQPNRVAAYPVGFGPFVPFGYPNGEFVKNGSPACAA